MLTIYVLIYSRKCERMEQLKCLLNIRNTYFLFDN